ncbi:MAG: sigma-70 family RNA polymerase sigma factor [Patescibacteria group bacterium]|jgi:RNA polymerase sigma-70 factor (ECF subfamily)
MDNSNDKNLVIQYLGGAEKSLDVLVKEYMGPIYGFIYQYVGNHHDAEDVAQEVFLRVWKNIRKFDLEKSFKTWIFSIAKNAAIDFLRKKKNINFSAFDDEDGDNYLEKTLVDPEPLADEIFDRADLADVVNRSFDDLSAKQRVVLSLYYQQQFTFAEISEMLGESVNTVKSRHHRALAVLRKKFS